MARKKKKSEAATVALRVEEILRLRIDGAEFHDLVQYASEKRWGISERQLRTYIRRADELLVERLDRNRRRVVARHLVQRQALYARALNAADYRTSLAILDSEAKLRSLYPEKGVAELVKLAAAQAQKLDELERRHAAGTHPSPAPEQRPPAGSTDGQHADGDGSHRDVPPGPSPTHA